jgi:hypothetical protein
MKKLFALILWTAALAPFTAQSQQQPGTLAGFLSGQGLVGVKLERRFGNHLFVPVSINNKRAALMIDTGAPVTIIDKNSAGTFALKVENTTINVGRIFGKRWEHYGVSNRLPHLNGLLGAREMNKFGMIIDCARQMLYIDANGPNTAVSQKLVSFLSGRGFTRIPMRLDSGNHLEVPAVQWPPDAIDRGHRCRRNDPGQKNGEPGWG